MIYEYCFHADPTGREIVPNGDGSSGFRCHHTRLDTINSGRFPWHWHSQFEIDYIEEGEVDLYYPDGHRHLRRGDIAFINTGIMHSYRTSPDKLCCNYAILFDMSFLSGMPGSALEQRYIYPIAQCHDLQAVALSPDSYESIGIVADVLRMIKLLREEPFGYELQLRSILSEFWLGLLKNTESLRASSASAVSTDTPRLKAMLAHIEEHYSEPVTLADIAAAAGISEREASRCFSRCIGVSPISYLNEHRLGMACRRLVETDSSILDISADCGFSSASYFGSKFREAYGCTPLEYRKKAANPGNT